LVTIHNEKEFQLGLWEDFFDSRQLSQAARKRSGMLLLGLVRASQSSGQSGECRHFRDRRLIA
jgi:hypothetical protein